MDPVTVLGGLSLLGGLIGSMAESDDARRQGREEAAALAENARMARFAAMDARDRGMADAGRARMAGSQVIGEQKAAIGASGVDPSSGSALALMADSRMMSELDAKTLEVNAAREAWGLNKQADAYDAQSRRARKRGSNAAAGALLGGLAGGAAAGARLYERG